MRVFKDIYNINIDKKENSILLDIFLNNKINIYNNYKHFKKDSKAEEISRKGAGEKLHFTAALDLLIKEDNVTNIIIKKQQAKGSILEILVKSRSERKDKETIKITLPGILIYELYLFLTENILFLEDLIKNADDDVASKNKAIKNKEIIEILKDINNKIYKEVSLKNLYEMKVDYVNLKLKEYLDLCLQEP